MQWDVKSADMKYLATMAKNESAIDTKKKEKETINKAYFEIMFSLLSWFQ